MKGVSNILNNFSSIFYPEIATDLGLVLMNSSGNEENSSNDDSSSEDKNHSKKDPSENEDSSSKSESSDEVWDKNDSPEKESEEEAPEDRDVDTLLEDRELADRARQGDQEALEDLRTNYADFFVDDEDEPITDNEALHYIAQYLEGELTAIGFRELPFQESSPSESRQENGSPQESPPSESKQSENESPQEAPEESHQDMPMEDAFQKEIADSTSYKKHKRGESMPDQEKGDDKHRKFESEEEQSNLNEDSTWDSKSKKNFSNNDENGGSGGSFPPSFNGGDNNSSGSSNNPSNNKVLDYGWTTILILVGNIAEFFENFTILF